VLPNFPSNERSCANARNTATKEAASAATSTPLVNQAAFSSRRSSPVTMSRTPPTAVETNGRAAAITWMRAVIQPSELIRASQRNRLAPPAACGALARSANDNENPPATLKTPSRAARASKRSFCPERFFNAAPPAPKLVTTLRMRSDSPIAGPCSRVANPFACVFDIVGRRFTSTRMTLATQMR